jgi:leader peptidase (prepilin peptidase)/N-methyltransferase
MYDILSIFASNDLVFVLWTLIGGAVGWLLKKLSGYLTHQVNHALKAEALQNNPTINFESVFQPTLHVLPSMEPSLPLIMSAVTLLFAALLPGSVAFASMFFVANCLLLAAVDAKTGILPNTLNSTLIVSGLIWQVLLNSDLSPVGLLAQADYVWAMGLGYIVPISLAWAYRCVTNVHPMGQGDAKMLAGMGAWLALDGLVVAVLIASLTASVWVLGFMFIGRYKRHQAVPFGPFLALGAITVVVWGVWLNHA